MHVFFFNWYVVSIGYQGCNSCNSNNRDLCKSLSGCQQCADSRWIPFAKDERVAHGHYRAEKVRNRWGSPGRSVGNSSHHSFLRKTTCHNSRKYSSASGAGKPVNDAGTLAIVKASEDMVRESINQSGAQSLQGYPSRDRELNSSPG